MPYPKYKPSGVEWLGDVPASWEPIRLKLSAPLKNSKITAVSSDLPYIGMENVESGTGRYVETEAEFEAEGMSNTFEPGDVLFGKLRPYLAKTYLTTQQGICSSEFLVLRGQKVIPQLLRYYLLSDEFVKQVDSSTYGSKMPRASWDFIGNMHVPVPAPKDQPAIVTFLDRETAKLDTLIAKQERLIELLQEKRQAMISHAVTKGLPLHRRGWSKTGGGANSEVPMKDSGIEWLGMVPEHWKVQRMATIFREVAEDGCDDLPILRVSIHDGVSDREFDDDELDRKVTRSEDKSKYKRVAPGDLVYNMMRAWQGGFGAVMVDGMVSPAYVVARPKIRLSTKYVEQLLRTPNAVEKLRLHSRGVTDFRLRLYWDEFKDIRIALPPYEEQMAIIQTIERDDAKADLIAEKCRRNIDLMREHRTALISAAVTGKIDVREAA